MGEIIIELATAPLDDEGEWHLLETREEIIAQLVIFLVFLTFFFWLFEKFFFKFIEQRQQQKFHLMPSDHLSPPSTIFRLSDSEASEMDQVDYDSEFGLNTSRG